MIAQRILGRTTRWSRISTCPIRQQSDFHRGKKDFYKNVERAPTFQFVQASKTFRTFATETGKSELDSHPEVDKNVYDRVCIETLDALCDYFEELVENASELNGTDVAYGDGVLTVKLGSKYGTYVINRQTPNKQIWLSSPTSGPKRYDFVGSKNGENGKWIYKHNGESLHELLQQEIPLILKDQQIDFFKLTYSS